MANSRLTVNDAHILISSVSYLKGRCLLLVPTPVKGPVISRGVVGRSETYLVIMTEMAFSKFIRRSLGGLIRDVRKGLFCIFNFDFFFFFSFFLLHGGGIGCLSYTFL